MSCARLPLTQHDFVACKERDLCHANLFYAYRLKSQLIKLTFKTFSATNNWKSAILIIVYSLTGRSLHHIHNALMFITLLWSPSQNPIYSQINPIYELYNQTPSSSLSSNISPPSSFPDCNVAFLLTFILLNLILVMSSHCVLLSNLLLLPISLIEIFSSQFIQSVNLEWKASNFRLMVYLQIRLFSSC
jgi:hypothetical protein